MGKKLPMGKRFAYGKTISLWQNNLIMEQGRIHGRISRVQLGRGSDAKTARKMPKKQMRYQRTNRPRDQGTDRMAYRVTCTRLIKRESTLGFVVQFHPYPIIPAFKTGDTKQAKARYGLRAREKIAKHAIDLQCNGFDCFVLVRNREMNSTWIQCSEFIWNEYKV